MEIYLKLAINENPSSSSSSSSLLKSGFFEFFKAWEEHNGGWMDEKDELSTED